MFFPLTCSYKDEESSYVSNSTSSWYGFPYMMQLENFKFSEIDTIFVDFTHIEKTEVPLATALREQYYR
jgi:DNA replication licensing factor MCM6